MSTFGKTLLYGAFAVILVIFAFNRRIQQGKFLSALAPILEFCMPADDLYNPVLKEPIDVSSDGKAYEFTFTNRYVGSHSFGVMASGLSQNIAEATIPQLALSVEFVVDGGQVLTADVSDMDYSFWTPHGDGFAYLRYEVPRDVPVGKAVHCRVRVTRGDPDLQAKHGPVMVYAGRD